MRAGCIRCADGDKPCNRGNPRALCGKPVAVLPVPYVRGEGSSGMMDHSTEKWEEGGQDARGPQLLGMEQFGPGHLFPLHLA